MRLLNFVSLTLIGLSSAALSQEDKGTPSFVDLSLNGIHFCDSTSAVAVLGERVHMVMESKDRGDHPQHEEGEAGFANAKNTELLRIFGSSKYSFFRFIVTSIGKIPRTSTLLSGVSSFISGKRIHLGMSSKEVLGILGKGYTKTTEGSATVFAYVLDDNAEVVNICGYPEYSGKYKFVNDKLTEFSFGFSW